MSRGIWFVAGAAAGVYAMVRGRRAAEALTADGLRDRWHALGAGARVLREEIAVAKAEKEAELRARLAARSGVPDQIGGGGAPSPILASTPASTPGSTPGSTPAASQRDTSIQEGQQ